jgi:hypothetical protein
MGFRLTIAKLIILVFLLCICLAALANPSPLWAGLTFGFALMALLAGALCCLFRRGEARALWAGFTLLGGGAFVALFLCPNRFDGVAMDDLLYSLLEVIHPFDMAKYQAMGDGSQKEAVWDSHRTTMKNWPAISKAVLTLACSALGALVAGVFALDRGAARSHAQRQVPGV